MLAGFTWLQFVCVALSLCATWYLIMLGAFYFKRIFRARGSPGLQLPESAPHNLMGKSKTPAGYGQLEDGMFSFAPAKPSSELFSGIPPLLSDDLEILLRLAAAHKITATDFCSLFKLVSAKHPGLSGDAELKKKVSDLLHQQLPFALSVEQVLVLWNH